MAVAGGEVKASVDNSTVGKLTRAYESVIGGSFARIGFDFVVDTSMASNTQVSVSLLNSAATQGTGVYIKQGVGIVSGLYFNGAGAGGATTTLLAWGSLVNGGRYHIEWSINPVSFYSFYSLYDPSGNLVATRSNNNAITVDWFNLIKVVIESNSNKTTVSRLAIDPSLVGSAATGKYFTNITALTIFQDDDSRVDFYIPGGGSVNELLVYFHGVGQNPNSTEMTTLDTGGAVIQGFLKEGVMLVVPAIPDGLGGSSSWGNDYGAASVATAIAYARGLIGNTEAAQHYLAYSMGGLTAGRLIGNDGQSNVRSLYLLRPCLDIAYLEQNTFQSNIDTAWGVSAQASYSAAQATFARGNPMGLLDSSPDAFADTSIFMDYGTTGDAIVPQANNCVPFDALLTTKGIAHKSSVKVYAGHTERSTVGDATAHLAQVKADSYTSVDSGAARAIAAAVWASTSRTLSSPSAADIATDGINTNRIFVLVAGPNGLRSQDTKTIIAGTPPNTYGVDFRNDAAANQKVYSIESVEIISGTVNGLTFGETTRNGGTQARFPISGVTVGSYVVRVTIKYGESGPTSRGDLLIKVVS